MMYWGEGEKGGGEKGGEGLGGEGRGGVCRAVVRGGGVSSEGALERAVRREKRRGNHSTCHPTLRSLPPDSLWGGRRHGGRPWSWAVVLSEIWRAAGTYRQNKPGGQG